MRIFLTGGTGFFGRALLRFWMQRAQEGELLPTITAISRTPEDFFIRYPEFAGLKWFSLHKGDILAPETFPPTEKYTHVLHAATQTFRETSTRALDYYEEITNGTRNVLDFAVSCGARRFLLTSSGAVYGPQPPALTHIPEDYSGAPNPLDPANAYGLGKRMSEHLCTLYQDAYGIETVSARCFAFVGPDMPLNTYLALGNFIRDALWGDEIIVSGNGMPVRSYLYQDNLAQWLLALLVRGAPGRAYNVGSEEAISIADLARLTRDIISPDKPVRILGQKSADGPRNLYVPDLTRIQRELGLEVSTSLRQAIAKTASTLRIKGPQDKLE